MRPPDVAPREAAPAGAGREWLDELLLEQRRCWQSG
jgi:hypothetical protein